MEATIYDLGFRALRMLGEGKLPHPGSSKETRLAPR